jgi:alanyl-tRNA synthetase
MKAADVRRTFLDFFAKHGHQPVASSSLVPANDPTLLFTNAGMNQFKDVFTGAETRDYKRATSSQKCVRAGGKHNDLDEVGRTPRHHTFFEMLGNFSFGDYFKADAIAFAWELLTKVFAMDPSRLVITVYGGDKELPGISADDEARALWKQVTGFDDSRIIGLGKKDNFWQMGDTGPMGPCTEIHYNMTGTPGRAPTADAASWQGWVEIWNLVFMQFERKVAGGPLAPLPAPSVDTGAGLERMTSVVQGVTSNYDTDLFQPIIQATAAIAGVKYQAGSNDAVTTALRVVADHARCSAFLIADGVFPDKTEREYTLRRIFRRAVRHGQQHLKIERPFMADVCNVVIDTMGDVYPELRERRSIITKVTLEEETRFRATLARGLEQVEAELGKRRDLPGDFVFKMYDTFGFPADLTKVIAEEHGGTIDQAGFDAQLLEAKQRSSFKLDDNRVADVFKGLASELGATRFLGYDGAGTAGTGTVRALVVDGQRVDRADGGAMVAMMFDQTPFYANSGGQIGDTGWVVGPNAKVRVDDTAKPAGDLFVLFGEVTTGALAVGDAVTFSVDAERRDRIRANHSATHLLNLALKKVLGDHVNQKGSLVAPDRLRFDFSHFSPLTEDQRRTVEDLVNTDIRHNADSVVETLAIEEARQRGAVAMFGEKYGAKVRVVRIGDESLEFCGGTHVHRAGDIGLFKIVSESGTAQGVRRIEAVTGAGALDYLRKVEDQLVRTGERLKAPPFEVATRVDKVLGDLRALEKEVERLKAKIAGGGGNRDLMAEVVDVKGVKVLAVKTEIDDPKVLRDTGDALRDKLGSGVLLLAGTGGDEVKLLAMVTKDLAGRVHAGKLLGAVAEVLGGRGGGRPDMAQGGGKDAGRIDEALAKARSWVEQSL